MIFEMHMPVMVSKLLPRALGRQLKGYTGFQGAGSIFEAGFKAPGSSFEAIPARASDIESIQIGTPLRYRKLTITLARIPASLMAGFGQTESGPNIQYQCGVD